MRSSSAKRRLRLSTRLFVTNILTSIAFLLIAAFIVYSFASVRGKLANVVDTDIEKVLASSRVTRELSGIFSDIDLLDGTFYGDTEYLRSEGGRLANEIAAAQESTDDQTLKASLLELSNSFRLFISQGVVFNEALRSRAAIDERIDVELTRLEQLIGDWLIQSTIEGEDTDFVTQQLALVVGYRETSLLIGKLYAEMNLGTRSSPSPLHSSPVIGAIDDLVLRLQTITASTPEVAGRAEIIRNQVLEHRVSIERVYRESARLQSLRSELNTSKDSVLSAMGSIETELSMAAQSAAGKIDGIVTFAAITVVVLTLFAIALVFFATRRLIRFNIQSPLRSILRGIEAFRNGDLRGRIELDREDEWEMIGQSLNSMAAELQETQQQLIVKERLATLGQLAAVVSHELRNPLGTISASSKVVQAKTEGKELGIEQALDRIERSITRCTTIIEDLLQFVRTKEPAFEPTIIDQWIGGILDEFNLPEGVTLNRALDSGIELPVDRESLRRALINIVDNAWQAIEIEREAGRSIQASVVNVSTRLGPDRLELSIRDTGPGIALEDRQKIFEPLFSTKAFGVGLGMPIVERILEQHGGGVEIDSEPGEGTEVVLWIPIDAH